MSDSFRNECKFIIDTYSAMLLKSKIAEICAPDTNCGEGGYYDIRSVYFDTFDDMYLQENLAGVNLRHKYRVRIYNLSANVINLERKETENGLKRKYCDIISKEQCLKLISGDILCSSTPNQRVLLDMQHEHLQKMLLPKMIVDYRRYPFVYKAGNVRITFDTDISCSNMFSDFFSESIRLAPVLPGDKLVLEVKYDDVLPRAIRDIINTEMDMNQTAFSKYALARELELNL